MSPDRDQPLRKRSFESFWQEVNKRFFNHPLIVANSFTSPFAKNGGTDEQVKELFRQFSVFSNQFIPIQAKRMANARSIEAERAARVILVSETGVGLDVEKGEVENKTFSHKSAHINWLRRDGEVFGEKEPGSYGRWDIALPSTILFLEMLEASYGSRNPNIGAGASFAIETWAAWGIGAPPAAGVGDHWREENNFWKQLVVGLGAANDRRKGQQLPLIPTGFFKYHFELERGHSASVLQELEETYHDESFNEWLWLTGGAHALDAMKIFWDGLSLEWSKIASNT